MLKKWPLMTGNLLHHKMGNSLNGYSRQLQHRLVFKIGDYINLYLEFASNLNVQTPCQIRDVFLHELNSGQHQLFA